MSNLQTVRDALIAIIDYAVDLDMKGTVLDRCTGAVDCAGCKVFDTAECAVDLLDVLIAAEHAKQSGLIWSYS